MKHIPLCVTDDYFGFPVFLFVFVNSLVVNMLLGDECVHIGVNLLLN